MIVQACVKFIGQLQQFESSALIKIDQQYADSPLTLIGAVVFSPILW